VARAGQTVENAATGERLVFVRTAADTGGELVEMESTWTRPGRRTPEHVHPEAEETWEVLEGSAAFRIGGEERTAGPGEVVVAPAGVAHVAWNAGEDPARVRITLRPALRWEDFVERLFELSSSGQPDRAALAELAAEYSREVAPAR
jgi:quercetin dioxygenase-like cupin family protein